MVILHRVSRQWPSFVLLLLLHKTENGVTTTGDEADRLDFCFGPIQLAHLFCCCCPLQLFVLRIAKGGVGDIRAVI